MTHPDLAAFVRQMRANPADDTLRLVAADWFEERGEADRAEFIRVQVELEKLRVRRDKRGRSVSQTTPRILRLRERELALLRVIRFGLPDGMSAGPDVALNRCTLESLRRSDSALTRPGETAQFRLLEQLIHQGACAGQGKPHAWLRGGFVAEVGDCSAANWLAHGDAVCEAHPVTRVKLTDWPGYAEEKSVGGARETPGYAVYSVAGRLIEGPPGGDPAVLFPIRWPGLAFEMPPPELPEFTRTYIYMPFGLDGLRRMQTLVGRVNDRPVMGQPAGGVLYVGSEARAMDPDDEVWQVTHRFRLDPDPRLVRLGAYAPADLSPLFAGGNELFDGRSETPGRRE